MFSFVLTLSAICSNCDVPMVWYIAAAATAQGQSKRKRKRKRNDKKSKASRCFITKHFRVLFYYHAHLSVSVCVFAFY